MNLFYASFKFTLSKLKSFALFSKMLLYFLINLTNKKNRTEGIMPFRSGV